MTHVQTVLGPVPAADLGPTDSHEHLFIRGGLPVVRYPDFRLDDYDRIAADAAAFRAAGGSAVVEMSPIDWGRDVDGLVRLARETGLHVVAATGFHKTSYYTDIHWLHAYPVEDIAALITAELEIGMDVHNYNGPLVRRSPARAGVIKVATHAEPFSDTERKLLTAAAMAHRATGAPILTHTEEGALALEQVEFLTAAGVPAHRIGLSHLDRRLDLGYHKEVASTGAFLEYDALTRVTKGFDKTTRWLVTEMVAAGFADRLLLGGDISRQGYWPSYGGAPGLAFLVGPFRATLLEAGLPADVVEQIYTGNPRALLAWSARPAAREPGEAGPGEAGPGGAVPGEAGPAEPATGRIRTTDDLVRRKLVAAGDAALIDEVAGNFAVAITPQLARLVDGPPSADPIARQFVPDAAELDVDPRELSDPIGDATHAATAAVVHRYPDRVLLKVASACPIYCRFCFRREFLANGHEHDAPAELAEGLAYIAAHPEIWEVVLTGGDPLMLPDRRLAAVVAELNAMDHVRVVRVHTRFPVAAPQRVTDALVAALRGRAAAYVVLHCNHPRELTAEVRAACRRFVDGGVPMLAQTALLRGVNDDPATLEELMRTFVELRIKPYYLHHLDLARGTGHFRTSVAEGQALVAYLRGRVSGLCQPTYVLDIPGGHGKSPIGPSYIERVDGTDEYTVEDYTGQRHTYVDLAAGRAGDVPAAVEA